MAAGLLLLTGASIAGIVEGTREGVTQTTRRVRESTGEFAAVVTGRSRPPAPERVQMPEPLELPDEEPDEADVPSDAGPVVRATHVEAPPLPWEEEEEEPADEPEAELIEPPEPEEAEVVEAPEPVEYDEADLTPQGR